MSLLYSRLRPRLWRTGKGQITQQDTDSLQQLGGWLFRHRTSLPIPIVLALLLIPPGGSSSFLSTSVSRLGVLTIAGGEAIRLWAVHHIGAISRTRSDRLGPLIDSGPFAHVRNPLYLGNILLWMGFALSADFLWLAPIVVALLAFEYHAIVRWEERLLTQRLGRAYADYSQRVPRWIPLVQGARSNDVSAMRVFSWGDTFFSERGTLIAIVAGLVLLALKSHTPAVLGFQSRF